MPRSQIYSLTIFHILFITHPLFLFAQSSIQDSTHSDDEIPVFEMDAIIVTGTRYEKKLIEIPYPVMRFKYIDYQYNRKVSVSDVLESVPGLFLQNRYGNHDVRISIRGFGSRSNSGIRGVRILLDGIPESEPDGQTRIEAIDFNSIAQIEVVRGNSSSLYTNAPGGVINFINEIYFPTTNVNSLNQFGSFGLRRNGIKAGVRSKNYTFLFTYTYHNYDGYRTHSSDYWHIVNTVLETRPNNSSHLQILGYFVDGLIRLPGSLTKEEFDENPFQAAQTEVDFDFRRVSTKGRLGIRFSSYLDKDRRNEIELTTYGTIKYFERTSRIYRIINRYGLGTTVRYLNRNLLFGRENEFSVGGDIFYQSGPIEYYQNIGGNKSDELTGLTDETIANAGFYFQDLISLYRDRLTLLLSGRYDKVSFDQKNQILQAQNDHRNFEDFTPKAALNLKLNPSLALYTSFGYSFDSPAGNELDNYPGSSNPGSLINPDLEPQKTQNLEIGIKGGYTQRRKVFFNNFAFEATVFNLKIDNEIVPFEVFSEVYYRNSAKTTRNGFELSTNIEIYKGLIFKLAYTLSDFKYDEYSSETIEIDSTGNVVANERDFSGNTPPSIPEHNLSVSLAFERELSKQIKGFCRGKYNYISGMYADDANSAKTEEYYLVNLSIGVDVNMGKFSCLLSGGVDNIFDELYVGFVNINSTSQTFYEAGAPRNYYATINMGYNF